MILNFNGDLLITHSFIPRSNRVHGLSGHTFEVLDYYYYFKKYKKVNVKCLLPEVVSEESFNDFIKGHYSEEFDKNDFYFGSKYHLIKCEKILVVDGGYWFLNSYKSMLLGEVFAFACGPSFFEPEDKPEHVKILADHKIYKGLGIDYTKKILPLLKRIKGDRPFAHVTKNCRFLNKNQIEELVLEYPDIQIFTDYLEHPNATKKILRNFEFSEYVYTPIARKFDCSPRLIIECQILGIPFWLWKIDYRDIGLERRLGDYREFILDEKDELFDIMFD